LIHEVKIYKPGGELKKIISRKALLKRHWKDFTADGDISVNVESGVRRSPVKKKAVVKKEAKAVMKVCVVCKADFPCFHAKKIICSPECYKYRQNEQHSAYAAIARKRLAVRKRELAKTSEVERASHG
jgi:hypothetical protein